MLYETFRHNLRAAIKAHPLPLKAISHKAGYNYSYIRAVMSGKKANPTLLFVESMAGALEVTPQDLLTYSQKERTP